MVMTRTWTSSTWKVGYPSPLLVSADPGKPNRPLHVYLHGMGESATSFERFWPKVAALDIHTVTPTGPFPFEKRGAGTITIGHAWYLYDGGDSLFKETTSLVTNELISMLRATERELGLEPRHRVLLGYSQGAYLGWLAALKHPDFFTHMVGVSGNLKEAFLTEDLSSRRKPTCLVVHGEEDPATPVEFAHRSHGILSDHGYTADLEILPGGHGLRGDRDETVATRLARELNR